MSRGFWKVPGEGGPSVFPRHCRPPSVLQDPCLGVEAELVEGEKPPRWDGASWVQPRTWDCMEQYGVLVGGYRFWNHSPGTPSTLLLCN